MTTVAPPNNAREANVGSHPPPVARATSSSRPRPISLPPQSYQAPNVTQSPARPGSSQGGDRERRSEDASQTAGQQKGSHRQPSNGKQRSAPRIVGDYTLGKTLGAGSMGKVKLATHNKTGEKLAVKILPRVHPTNAAANTPNATPEAIAKQQSKDASKEIRTLREAALSLLLHHPYICGMREMIIHQHHYYMVFEYVNGGQMLDYIISHGRLREKKASRFARQIGSALDYCHRNNVVHRDLKIENILISHSANIKIIDFGLSNLYDPASRLHTFCGSLYFAAPELLNAKVYTGPEVDVWSFGVVLYVLVCGKVPFDDQSMPALHAKIKRGLVEYPVWLSAECKHLLSRMLVTNPLARAPLSEVLAHPWMTRNYPGPPVPHVLPREPLRPDALEREVVDMMTGFEFGTSEEIEARLNGVLNSELYQRAVSYWERGRGSGNSRSSSNLLQDDGSSPQRSKTKRFSGFDFYRRKLLSPPGTPNQTNSPSTPSYAQDNMSDPTRAFHPLISIYYLAREKMERERVYGPGHFASSQLSLEDDKPPSPPAKIVSANPLSSTPTKPDYGMALPRLPPPASPHYSGMSYDNSGPVPSPTTPGFAQTGPQPRARDTGLVNAEAQQTTPTRTDPSSPAPLAVPAASTHRRSHSLSQKPSGVRTSMFGDKDRDLPSPVNELGAVPEPENEREKERVELPMSATLRRFGSMLSGRSGEDGARKKRSTILGGLGSRTSDVGSRDGGRETPSATPIIEDEQLRSQTPTPHTISEKSGGHRRAATILDPLGRGRHERRSSTGGALLPSVGGTFRRMRRPSTGQADGAKPLSERIFGRAAETDTEAPPLRSAEPGPVQDDSTFIEEDEKVSTEKDFKPVFLKGLFSFSTTSPKPPAVIKADLRKVLDRMQIQYHEVKNGFECVHVPSIDVSAYTSTASPVSPATRRQPSTNGNHESSRRSIVRKASKLSGISLSILGKDKDDKENREGSIALGRPSTTIAPSPSSRSSIFFNKDQPADAGKSQELNGLVPAEDTLSQSTPATVSTSKGLPPIPHDMPLPTPSLSVSRATSPTVPMTPLLSGEVTKEVFDVMGANRLSVRFDITIVKVPWLNLHGIQFRRASGDGWQYQMLAKRVLTELKL